MDPKIPICMCDGLMCCGGAAMAVFAVTRDGKRMTVCTHCDFRNDENKVILAYVFTDLMDWDRQYREDALGALCLKNYIETGEVAREVVLNKA